ncbi:hypothetical protein FRC00_002224 [Tulasnella sp. 408]|nr:hypothetical protein FRC00_002224 [Tulasnella sp. 408]
MWAKHLAKSQNQSLQVYCTCPDTKEQPFMLDLVKDALERVEQLHCSVDNNSDVPRPTEDFFTQPETVEVIAAIAAPSLQQLHFQSNRYRPWILEALFDGIAPNLRNVQLSYVSIPWRLLCQTQRLETVIIDCAPHLPSPFEILYIFKSCPNLLKFHIRKDDAASFVVISEPVWYEPLQIPWPKVLASGSLQSFVAAELPVPGLHYILEHLTFPQSASIDISVKQAPASQTPLPIASLIILSDVISVADDSHIELWITGQTIEVRDQDIKVRFHNAITTGNYHEVLLAIPSNMRNGVARVILHSELNLQEATELLAAVTSLFPSISEMECCFLELNMRQKRAKTYRKQMTMYQEAFGFHAPFQILMDSGFCTETFRLKLLNTTNVTNLMSRTVQEDCKLIITQCCISELYKLGQPGQPVVDMAKTFERNRCNHREAIPAEECISSIVGKKNKNRYIVATQSDELREKLRSIPAVPIIHVKRGVLVLEPPSDATKKKKAEASPTIIGLMDESTLHAKEDEVPTDQKPQQEPKRKPRGPKQPNPLSIKKKKIKGPPPANKPKEEGTEAAGTKRQRQDEGDETKPGEAKHRRKRRRGNGVSEGPLGVEAV